MILFGRGWILMDELNIFLGYGKRLMEAPFWKVVFGLFMGLVQMLFGDIMRPVLLSIGFLWFWDAVTGLRYARANPKITPNSRRMRMGVYKLGFYIILVSVGHLCTAHPLTSWLSGIIYGVIMVTEVWSIFENIDDYCRLQGREIKFIRVILNLLRGRIKEELGEEIAAAILPDDKEKGKG